MSRLIALGPVVCLAAVFTVAADPPAKKEDAADKVRKRFYSGWLEIERLEGGVKITDPEKLSGSDFSPEQVVGWGRRGELSLWVGKPGPRIDPTTDPMRVDFLSVGYVDSFPGGRVAREDEKFIRVDPCIFKFEDGNLVIAYSTSLVKERKHDKGEDYTERPKDFTSTKENKRKISIMKPSGIYIQD